MADQREFFSDPEEAFRSAWAGVRSHMYTSLPAIVAEDSDGKTLKLQIAVKQQISDKTYDETTYKDFPPLVDVPLHSPGGGPVTHTFPHKKGDEVMAVFSSRSLDAWFQSGGSQQPIFNRYHSLSDAMAVPGWRSMPREIQQISTSTAQIRTDDKHHVVDVDPQAGLTVKSVDPSTAPASTEFDPFLQAAVFYLHRVFGGQGVHWESTSGGSQHTGDLTHAAGHAFAVANGLHSVLAHPENGASLNAANLLHQVLAHPTLGALLSAEGGQHTVEATPEGVQIQSSAGISLSTPSLNLPANSISASALGGSAAQAIGNLGGDLGGELPNPQVLSIAHVAGANSLPNAANDAAAAALTPPVAVGHLYRNGSTLCVRVA